MLRTYDPICTLIGVNGLVLFVRFLISLSELYYAVDALLDSKVVTSVAEEHPLMVNLASRLV